MQTENDTPKPEDEIQQESCGASISSDLLAVARPPARINGKPNPEYQRWYRKTEKGKAQVAKWNAGDGHKKALAKYRKTDSGRQVVNKAKRRYKEKYPNGMRRCVECGSEYAVESILSREWPLVGKFGCICDLCG